MHLISHTDCWYTLLADYFYSYQYSLYTEKLVYMKKKNRCSGLIQSKNIPRNIFSVVSSTNSCLAIFALVWV